LADHSLVRPSALADRGFERGGRGRDRGGGYVVKHVVKGVVELATTADDKRQAREALLALLAHQTTMQTTAELAHGVAELATTTEDKRHAREALLALIAGQTSGLVVPELIAGLAQLTPGADDKRRTREAVADLLTYETDSWIAKHLLIRLIDLDPTVRDLDSWRSWALPPPVKLLAAARRNSTLAAWLTALPSLTSLSA
jgi:hypothetical protein